VLRRRVFGGVFVCAVLVTLRIASAEPAGRVYRLGVLTMGAPTEPSVNTGLFFSELARLGLVEGANLVAALLKETGVGSKAWQQNWSLSDPM
jgi:hypothetical protein